MNRFDVIVYTIRRRRGRRRPFALLPPVPLPGHTTLGTCQDLKRRKELRGRAAASWPTFPRHTVGRCGKEIRR